MHLQFNYQSSIKVWKVNGIYPQKLYRMGKGNCINLPIAVQSPWPQLFLKSWNTVSTAAPSCDFTIITRYHMIASKRSCETQLLQYIAFKLKGRNQVAVAQNLRQSTISSYDVQNAILRSNVAELIQSFLSNRKKKVLLEGEMSSEKDVFIIRRPSRHCIRTISVPEIYQWPPSDTKLFAYNSILFREINSQHDANFLQKKLDAIPPGKVHCDQNTCQK